MLKKLIAILHHIYHITFILYVFFLFSTPVVTVIIGYANRNKDSDHFRNIYKHIISDELASDLYKYRYEIALTCLILICLTFLIKHIITKNRINKLTKSLEDYAFEYSNYRTNFELKLKKLESDKDYDQISIDIVEFVQKTLNNISKTFTVLTGYPCHTSLKSYLPETGEIITHCRDNTSIVNRSLIDEEFERYSYKENTAFKEIIENHKKDFWYSNHLKFKAMLGKYDNCNPNFKKLYSATIVVPISSKRTAGGINEKTILGFICVDNKGGKFNSSTCKNILLALTSLNYFIIELHGRIPVALFEAKGK